FLLISRPPPCPTLFPYTTLFRSNSVMILDPTFGSLYESPQGLPGNNMIGAFSQPSAGDLDQDGHPDIIALGASFTLALALSSKEDRKSTRLNSSHRTISYAVFCL